MRRSQRILARLADRLLWAIMPILEFLSPFRRSCALPPRVLLVRCDHIGDAAVAAAFARSLRERLRPAQLDVLAGPWGAELFRATQCFDTIHIFSAPWWVRARGGSLWSSLSGWGRLPGIIRTLRRLRYDLVIEPRGDLRQILFFGVLVGAPSRVSTDRSGGERLLTHRWPFAPRCHQIEQTRAVLGVAGLDCSVGYLERSDPMVWQSLRDKVPTAPYIVLAMQGSQPNRAVPLERAIAIANAVNEAGYHTVYIGGGNERAFADSICAAAGPDNVNLAGETTLVEAMETVRRAAGAIMIDSGPMNIASLVNIPIVGLYGPSDPAEHRPWSQCATVVGRGPCGCSKAGCRFRAGPGSCMMELDARQIVSELRRMLSTSDRTCA